MLEEAALCPIGRVFPMDIQTPTLVLNHIQAKRNIQHMADKAKQSGVRFRPHFKTHQSAEVGQWFREVGVETITVSSIDMALYFANHGWQDITVAFPANPLEIDKINELASSIQLNLLVESEDIVCFLEENLRSNLNVWIKVDTGYGRTGIPWDAERLINVANAIQQTEKLQLQGLLTHAGHSYRYRSKDQVKALYADYFSKFKAAQKRLEDAGVNQLEMSLGDTPSCSIMDDFSGINEIRPGNFVFYDLMQFNIGSCSEDEISLAVACPVVAKHEERGEVIIYGGAVHLSKDFVTNQKGLKSYGGISLPTEDGTWGPMLPNCYVSSLSQEHGIVRLDDTTFAQTKLGDILMIIPVHSCLTVNLLKKYFTPQHEEIQVAKI